MADDFDVYHKWLGIPRHEQPGNYYRLLGLTVYESDPEVIQRAADRQCAYVGGLYDEPRGDLVPALLAELTEAADCLLVPERKRLYDEGLRAGQEIERRNPEIAPPVMSKSAHPAQQAIVNVEKQAPAAQASLKIAVSASGRPGQPPTNDAPHVALAVSKKAIQLKSASSKQSRSKRWLAVGVSGVTALLTLIAIMVWNNASRLSDRAAAQTKTPVSPAPQAIEQDTMATTAIVPGTVEADATIESSSTLDAPQSGDTVADPDIAPLEETPAPIVVESSLPEAIQIEPSTEVAGDDATKATSATEATPPTESESAVARHNSNVDVSSTARGSILREIWRNVPGNKVDEFERYVSEHPQPSEVGALDRFESPEDEADNYGQRVRGFLFPPTTGEYVFSIRANAEGVLYLNDVEHPDERRLVAEDEKVRLEAGLVYSVEAFHKESTGKDNFSIGWTLPDGTVEMPISGLRLSIAHRIPPAHERGFVPLETALATASAGSTLQISEGGTILASGEVTTGEVYRVVLRIGIERLTGLRLETLPHDSLPGSGPGRAVAGRFALSEVSLNLLNELAAEPSTPLPIRAAVDAVTGETARVLDGKAESVWRGDERGAAAAVVLVLTEPLLPTSDSQLELTITNREPLGCFRVLGTSAPDPLKLRAGNGATSGDLGNLFVLHANLGGEDHTAPDGVVWRKSTFFDNLTFGHEGGRSVVEEDVQNPVQGSAIRGITAFRAVVPNGTYDVTLYFAEYWSTAAGSRRFSVAAEQRPVAVNFDLLQTAGFAHPFTMPLRNVVVRDERLDIDFQPATPSSSTVLNAIRIQQVK